jgi:uncharacterized iron-regulated protein
VLREGRQKDTAVTTNSLRFGSALAIAFTVGCGGNSPSPSSPNTPPADGGTQARSGRTYANAADAPKYPGTAFSQMQLLDLEKNEWLDESALLEALDATKLVFMGEQHETAPVQELELWLLERMTKRHDDVTLAMEHFQRDEQPVIDSYLAGKTTTADFERTSDPWPKYATYWKPLVEHMKAAGRPVAALNVPEEALESIYGAYPKKPLEVFNGWTSSFKYDSAIAPRPLSQWDATYQSYFETSFDYNAHGKQMGMTRADALVYFAGLAHIRDETMAYFTAKALEGGGRVLAVAGDWHVQTGLATPDRVARYRGDGETGAALVSTTPASKLEETRSANVSGRKLARFIMVYQ